jgi:hypothetical protein
MLRLDAAFGQKIADISIILHVFMSNQVRAMSATSRSAPFPAIIIFPMSAK